MEKNTDEEKLIICNRQYMFYQILFWTNIGIVLFFAISHNFFNIFSMLFAIFCLIMMGFFGRMADSLEDKINGKDKH